MRTAQRSRPGLRARWQQWLSSVQAPPLPFGIADELRAMTLLKENLSPEQLRQFESRGSFDVIGGATGRRYRILRGTQMNVQLLDRRGICVTSLCFTPRGHLPSGDVMLAQKLGLELFEDDVLKVANRSWPPTRW
jgi:hypothetical protein